MNAQICTQVFKIESCNICRMVVLQSANFAHQLALFLDLDLDFGILEQIVSSLGTLLGAFGVAYGKHWFI